MRKLQNFNVCYTVVKIHINFYSVYVRSMGLYHRNNLISKYQKLTVFSELTEAKRVFDIICQVQIVVTLYFYLSL